VTFSDGVQEVMLWVLPAGSHAPIVQCLHNNGKGNIKSTKGNFFLFLELTHTRYSIFYGDVWRCYLWCFVKRWNWNYDGLDQKFGVHVLLIIIKLLLGLLILLLIAAFAIMRASLTNKSVQESAIQEQGTFFGR